MPDEDTVEDHAEEPWWTVNSDYYEPWWTARSEFTPDQPRLRLAAKVDLLSLTISEKLGRQVKSIKYLANGFFHTVYEIDFEFGPAIISRIAFNFKDTKRGRAAVSPKMKQEVNVLRLVKAMAPTVPVPIVFYSDSDPHNVLGAPFMLMEKLPGCASAYNNLNGADIEAFVESLAKVYVGVFEITLPKIGSYLETSSKGELIIGPVIDDREENPGGPFETVNEFLEWLFSSTLNHLRNKSSSQNVNLPGLFARLSDLAQLLIPHNLVERIVLTHLDPHERNLLVEGTEVTGLIDWEVQGSLPNYLAACYPAFLKCSGIFDERYVNNNRDESGDGNSNESANSGRSIAMMDTGLQLSSEEVQHLRKVFVKATEKLNPEFSEALQQGEGLRDLLDWLKFAEWDGQWVWKGCEQWEDDVRTSITS